MNPKAKIYFRADGNSSIGLGHVTRSLALVEMLSNDYDCHFIIRNPNIILRNQILDQCTDIITLPNTENDLHEAQQLRDQLLTSDDIIVLDGYHFNTDYQRIIKNTGCTVVSISDMPLYHYVSDVVINHAPCLDAKKYSVEAYTQMCLGLDYSLLRKPFLSAAQAKRIIRKIDNIFICFGGSDFNNVTLKILRALGDSKLFIRQINVVIGGANVHNKEINSFVESCRSINIRLYHNLSDKEMCVLMLKSELAIVPASSILFEITAVKMPVISGYYVDNQINVHKGFDELGLILSVGDFNKFENYAELIEEIIHTNTDPIISRQSHHQRGKSKQHFLNLFKQLRPDAGMTYRKTTEEDMLLYFDWVNDHIVRQNSISTEPIQLKDHQRWFENHINNQSSEMYIFEWDNVPLGQVRFDIKDDVAVIDYSIDKNFRGQQLGTKMLQRSISILMDLKRTDFSKVVGMVKVTNTPSVKIFERLGFKKEQNHTIGNIEYFVFSLPNHILL